MPDAGFKQQALAGQDRQAWGGDWSFFANEILVYINYRRLGEKVKEVIVHIPNALMYKLCNRHSQTARLQTILFFLSF